MAFKLKSGNTTNFKSMGSSPAQQKVNMNDPKVAANYAKHKDNPKYRAALDKKSGGKFEYDEDSRTSTVSTPAKQKTEYAKAVSEGLMNKGVPHNNWGREGYNSITGRPSNNMGLPKDFNTKGSKGGATPGHKTTKVAKSKANPKAIKGKHYPDKTTVQKLRKGPYAKGGQNAQLKTPSAKNFNTTGSSKAGKFAKVAKKVAGKAGKFLGGKALGVAGMLMATSSKADQPTKGKGKKEYEGGKLDFFKKK